MEDEAVPPPDDDTSEQPDESQEPGGQDDELTEEVAGTEPNEGAWNPTGDEEEHEDAEA